MTISELALNEPPLFKTSTMLLTEATVPLHFQLPPMRAFAIFLDILDTAKWNWLLK